jgi:hypothetical protein
MSSACPVLFRGCVIAPEVQHSTRLCCPAYAGQQSRFGVLTFGDFDATLALRLTLYPHPGMA